MCRTWWLVGSSGCGEGHPQTGSWAMSGWHTQRQASRLGGDGAFGFRAGVGGPMGSVSTRGTLDWEFRRGLCSGLHLEDIIGKVDRTRGGHWECTERKGHGAGEAGFQISNK